MRTKVLFVGLTLLLNWSYASGATDGDRWVESALQAARHSLEVPWIGGSRGSDASSSPSADFIAYSERRSSVAANSRSFSLMLAHRRAGALGAIDATEVLEHVDTHDPNLVFEPTFSRDGSYLAYRSGTSTENESRHDQPTGSLDSTLVVFSLRDKSKIVADLRSMPVELLGPHFSSVTILRFSLSPNGKKLGLIVAGAASEDTSNGIEPTTNDLYWTLDTKPTPSRLVIYDLTTRKWTTLAPADIDVHDFDWSPDGKRIVFSGVKAIKAWQTILSLLFTDIYLLDLENGNVSTIISQPGADLAPIWSPDGKWIAFKSQAGIVRWVGESRIGLYRVYNGAITYPGFAQLGQMSGYGCGQLKWSSDSRTLIFNVPYHLSKQIFRMSIPGGSLAQITSDADASNYYPVAEFGGDHSLLFIDQSFFSPPEIYVSSTVIFHPIRLTNSNPGSSDDRVHVSRLSWPTQDGRWRVSGWFLEPKTSIPGTSPPLLVYAEGGPDMVDAAFLSGGNHYPLSAFLEGGVAVFIPNSRGRAGYGTEFESAWETEANPGRGALEDDLDGINELAKNNLVDPKRVAIAGHSWGGYLAAYALTHTQRFSAVLVDEAIELNALDGYFPTANNQTIREFAKQQGFANPFEPTGSAQLRSISPIYEVSNAATPVLLEFGLQGANVKDAMAFFQGLKYFNKAPAELVVYPRSGHITEDIKLRMEVARRDLEWFAYWVLGNPTQRMLEKYGPPKIS